MGIHRPERRASIPCDRKRWRSRTQRSQELRRQLQPRTPGKSASVPGGSWGSATGSGGGWKPRRRAKDLPQHRGERGKRAGEGPGAEGPLAPGNLGGIRTNRAESLPAASPDPTQRRLLHPPSGAQPAGLSADGNRSCTACLPATGLSNSLSWRMKADRVPSSWGHRGPRSERFPCAGTQPVALPFQLEDGRSCSPAVTLH